MIDSTQESPSPSANKFWELTREWYFFPISYLLLSIIFALIWISIMKSTQQFLTILLYALYFMPNGFILLLPNQLNGVIQNSLSWLFRGTGEEFLLGFPLVMHPLLIISIILISFFKYKRNKVLKWLIITLLLFMILSFVGCVTNIEKIINIKIS